MRKAYKKQGRLSCFEKWIDQVLHPTVDSSYCEILISVTVYVVMKKLLCQGLIIPYSFIRI
jgi:hypothetical protein